MNKIDKSEDMPYELKDLLIKSLERDDDPRVLEVKKTIEDIAYQKSINLKKSLTEKDIFTIWNEYLERISDPPLGIEETFAKDTKYVIFVVGLLSIIGVSNSMLILEHVVDLAKIGFPTAILLRAMDIVDKYIEKKNK